VKIYTRKGDAGWTKLFGGKRASKSSPRITAYGDVDEVIAVLGVAASDLEDGGTIDLLRKLQSGLHLVCADLANPNLQKQAKRIEAEHIEALEKLCDEFEEKLPPLKKFILPGGSAAGAALHLSRTVARRAERQIVTLSQEESINPEVLRYMNRVSDLLFLIARWVNHQAGVPEHHPGYE
jgi:cob(I)alamin adenosyltransferase